MLTDEMRTCLKRLFYFSLAHGRADYIYSHCTAASFVAVRPVLGLEGETVGDLAQEHLGNADPVGAVGAGEQRLQIVPAHKPGDALVHPLGRPLLRIMSSLSEAEMSQCHLSLTSEHPRLDQHASGKHDARHTRTLFVAVAILKINDVAVPGIGSATLAHSPM